MLEEPLIFEIGDTEQTGVDFAEASDSAQAGSAASNARGRSALPGLSEPETVRHYTRLSRQNYAIDLGLFPLGSCTMKHNPRLNEKIARLPGFADVHPLQPQETVQGALQVIDELAVWLLELDRHAQRRDEPEGGRAWRAVRPARASARRSKRAATCARSSWCPESAHGTNPATAAFAGYRVENIPATAAGRVDLEALKARLGPDVAAVMITNPNTCGLFEPDMKAICDAVHAAGGFVYCDGANFNAIVGQVRPGDLGIDAMHINLHKTFSTPHGGGGPGSGPVVLSEALAPFAPLPFVGEAATAVRAGRGRDCGRGSSQSLRPDGRLPRPDGHVHPRAHLHPQPRRRRPAAGRRGCGAQRQLHPAQPRRMCSTRRSRRAGRACTRRSSPTEALRDGITTLDLAKALIDEGFHPMTMYFPLVVHGAMLVEPTETESKAELDQFIGRCARSPSAPRPATRALKAAPVYAPRRRLDETLAARKPVLTYKEAAGGAGRRVSFEGKAMMQVQAQPVHQGWISYAITIGDRR